MEQETARRLQRGLERLPVQLREPLVLTTVRELSHAQAGQALGVTSKAIENRVRRARTLLAREMRNTGNA
jgi:RNA polymerase sigma-70 factor (ECF subfamily)